MSSLKSYLAGFIASVLLTLLGYMLVSIHINSGHVTFSHEFLIFAVIALALTQAIVQLIFFLHLGKGKDARWNLVVFVSTLAVILIVVVGSVWIMNHLNSNMTPDQMNAYMIKSEGF